jgi:O-antigen/teichoic acid export membrane protein
MIPTAISFSLLTEGAYDQNNLKSNIFQSLMIIFMVLLPTVLFVLFFGDFILLLFGSNYSSNGSQLLAILAVAGVPLAINTVYITVKRIHFDTIPLIYINGFAALFSIIFSYMYIPSIGISAIGIGWLLAQAIPSVCICLSLIIRMPRAHAKWITLRNKGS